MLTKRPCSPSAEKWTARLRPIGVRCPSNKSCSSSGNTCRNGCSSSSKCRGSVCSISRSTSAGLRPIKRKTRLAERFMPPFEIKIEKLIYGGEGLAYHNGATVFVPFVLPGELVRATPVEEKKKFVRARVEQLLESSPARITPRCQHYTVCGGCDYQHIPYESQLNYKTEILRETLRRLGRIEWPGVITTHASLPWAYRNRAQWKVRPLEAN